MYKTSVILVTGARVMAGKAVVEELRRQGYTTVITTDKNTHDLTSANRTFLLFHNVRPDYVFHVAAKVGGIQANDTKSADFLYENLMMECNVIHHAKLYGVKKLIFCGSACIYPKDTPMPIKEEYLLTSSLEETNKAYAISKIAGVMLCEMYRKQYGCNFISVMPTNLYGENDNFHLRNSHVLPALIRKFYEAKKSNSPTVEVWGNGEARREFLYIGDLAKALIFLMNNYDESGHLNVGTGVSDSIKDIVEYLKNLSGFEGEVIWNNNYPNGVSDRRMDITKIWNLGWEAKVNVWDGIEKTYRWFSENYDTARK